MGKDINYRIAEEFNNGWWNCFECFAAEVFYTDAYADETCIHVLSGAGITKQEAQEWLDNHSEMAPPKVVNVVKNYIKFGK